MVETVPYKVRKNDCLWNIVKDAGFPAKDWEKIYKAPYNSKFKAKLEKEKRKPDLIYKGEVFYLPKYNPAELDDLILQLEDGYSKLDKALKGKKKFDKSINKIEKMKGDAERLLAELSKQLDWMNEVDRIQFQKMPGDPGVGLKIGKAMKQLGDKRRIALEGQIGELRREIRQLNEPELKKKVKRLKDLSKQADGELGTLEKEILALRKALIKNHKSAY